MVILGLGPIGDMAARIAQHHGARVIAVDMVPERLQRSRDRGIEVINFADQEADSANSFETRRTDVDRIR